MSHSKQGQATTEYILLIAAIVGLFLLIKGPLWTILSTLEKWVSAQVIHQLSKNLHSFPRINH